MLIGLGELASRKKRQDLQDNSCSESEIIHSRDQQVNVNELLLHCCISALGTDVRNTIGCKPNKRPVGRLLWVTYFFSKSIVLSKNTENKRSNVYTFERLLSVLLENALLNTEQEVVEISSGEKILCKR